MIDSVECTDLLKYCRSKISHSHCPIAAVDLLPDNLGWQSLRRTAVFDCGADPLGTSQQLIDVAMYQQPAAVEEADRVGDPLDVIQ